jgi:hypothetical protein
MERVVTLATSDPELLATMKGLTIRPRAMTSAEFFEAIKTQAPTVESISYGRRNEEILESPLGTVLEG